MHGCADHLPKQRVSRRSNAQWPAGRRHACDARERWRCEGPRTCIAEGPASCAPRFAALPSPAPAERAASAAAPGRMKPAPTVRQSLSAKSAYEASGTGPLAAIPPNMRAYAASLSTEALHREQRGRRWASVVLSYCRAVRLGCCSDAHLILTAVTAANLVVTLLRQQSATLAVTYVAE